VPVERFDGLDAKALTEQMRALYVEFQDARASG
jgi:hypothetical protein